MLSILFFFIGNYILSILIGKLYLSNQMILQLFLVHVSCILWQFATYLPSLDCTFCPTWETGIFHVFLTWVKSQFLQHFLSYLSQNKSEYKICSFSVSNTSELWQHGASCRTKRTAEKPAQSVATRFLPHIKQPRIWNTNLYSLEIYNVHSSTFKTRCLRNMKDLSMQVKLKLITNHKVQHQVNNIPII